MEYKQINNFDNYIICENGDVYNIKTKKKITYCKIKHQVKLYKNKKTKNFTLSRLIYETYYEPLTVNDVVSFKDNNKENFHYKNLIKIKRSDMLKVENHIELDNNKEWKIIKDYEEYKISNYGDIFSLKSNKILNPIKNFENYFYIKLIKNNKRNSLFVHRLVYDTFKNINDIENTVIDHIDNNPSNNFIDNLREVSKSENSYNRIFPKKIPDKIYQYSLNNEFIKEWNNYDEIKNTLNFNSSHISNCCLNKIKKAYNFIWRQTNIIYDLNELKNFITIQTGDSNTFLKYKINKNGDIINHNNMIMKYHIQYGYKVLELISDNNTSKTFKIHRLVALTFLNNLNNYPIVNHIDENKLNNSIENLQWCTNKQNITHSSGQKINQIDIDTNKVIKVFDSINDAFRELNKNYGNNIRLACEGKRKTAFGYKWSFVN